MDIDQAIEVLEKDADLLRERLQGHMDSLARLKELAKQNRQARRPRQVEPSKGARLRECIKLALADKPNGLHRKDIWAKLVDAGLYDGKHEQKELSNLSFQLSGHKSEFEKAVDLGPGYWKLTAGALQKTQPMLPNIPME